MLFIVNQKFRAVFLKIFLEALLFQNLMFFQKRWILAIFSVKQKDIEDILSIY